MLGRLRRVDPMQPDTLAVHLQRVAVHHRGLPETVKACGVPGVKPRHNNTYMITCRMGRCPSAWRGAYRTRPERPVPKTAAAR